MKATTYKLFECIEGKHIYNLMDGDWLCDIVIEFEESKVIEDVITPLIEGLDTFNEKSEKRKLILVDHMGNVCNPPEED